MDFLERMDAIAKKIVLPQEHANYPTFRCPKCEDRGLTVQNVRDRRHVSEANGAGKASAAWFCTCDAGEAAEAGYWFDAIYPREATGRRHKFNPGYASFTAYLQANRSRAFGMEARIEALRQKYERERSRKLEETGDE